MLKYNLARKIFSCIFVAIVACTAIMHINGTWITIALVIIWISYVMYGAFRMRAQVFLNSICSLAIPYKNNIVLTFDDGPHPEVTPRILDLLATHHAKAVFFSIGKNLVLYPELAKRIVTEGHILANHSYNHSNFIGIFSTKKVIKEIQQTEAEIERFMPSLKLYRPPFGVTNPNIARATSALNMKVIGWNKRSFDTVSNSEKAVLDRVLSNIQNGDIVLFHDTQPITPAILADFLLFAINKGFTFEVNAIKHK